MNHDVYSPAAIHIARGVILDYLRDNTWWITYDFLTKSTGQLFRKNLFPLYVDYIKPAQAQMAYRRRYKRRRVSRRRRTRRGSRRYGRRRFRRGGRSRLARRLRSKGILSAEIKYRDDEALSGRALSFDNTTEPIIAFTYLTEGIDYQSRIGSKVFIRKIKIGMHIGASEASAAPNEQYVRWIVVRDKNPDLPAVAANLGEVVQAFYPSPSTNNEAWISMFKYRWINNRLARRFQWLWSGMTKVIKDPGAGQQNVMIEKIINVFQPCYYGDMDALNDRGGGQIYMFAWSNVFLPNDSDHPYMDISYRVSFTDV